MVGVVITTKRARFGGSLITRSSEGSDTFIDEPLRSDIQGLRKARVPQEMLPVVVKKLRECGYARFRVVVGYKMYDRFSSIHTDRECRAGTTGLIVSVS